MGCLVVLASAVSPRLGIFLLWLLDDERMSRAFTSGWVAIIGFFLLPWTTLAWAVCYAPLVGVTGFGWFVVIIAFLADLGVWGNGARAQRRRAGYE